MMFNKTPLKITCKKKLNPEPSGSTEMTYKHLPSQFLNLFYFNSCRTWFIKKIKEAG